MRLPDPLASRIALIGTAEYATEDGLPDVSAVANNLAELRSIFSAPELGGLPARHVQALLNPATPAEVDQWLSGIARTSRDLLLVYYSGHGLIGDDEELYLTVSGSDLDRIHSTSVPFAWIKRAMLETPAPARILILDCCHSGHAMVRMGRLGSSVSAVLNQIDIEGTHVLTASGPSQAAHAGDGHEFTAFTDVLVQLLRHGINGGPELLTSSYLFPYLRQALLRAGLPKPHQQSKNTAGQLGLVRNAAFGSGSAPALQLPGPAEPVAADEIVSRHEYVPAAESLRELHRRTPQFIPRHYDQLAAVYLDEGYEDDVDLVLMEKERRRYGSRAQTRKVTAPLVLIWSWLQRALTGYGYRPGRAVVWLVTMVALGTIWFGLQPPPVVNNETAHLVWNPLLFTLDQVIPIVDLGYKNRWVIIGANQWMVTLLNTAGWVLAATIAATVRRR